MCETVCAIIFWHSYVSHCVMAEIMRRRSVPRAIGMALKLTSCPHIIEEMLF